MDNCNHHKNTLFLIYALKHIPDVICEYNAFELQLQLFMKRYNAVQHALKIPLLTHKLRKILVNLGIFLFTIFLTISHLWSWICMQSFDTCVLWIMYRISDDFSWQPQLQTQDSVLNVHFMHVADRQTQK